MASSALPDAAKLSAFLSAGDALSELSLPDAALGPITSGWAIFRPAVEAGIELCGGASDDDPAADLAESMRSAARSARIREAEFRRRPTFVFEDD